VLIVEDVDCEGMLVAAPEICKKYKEFSMMNADFCHVTVNVISMLPPGKSNHSGHGAFIEPAGHGPMLLFLKYVIG